MKPFFTILMLTLPCLIYSQPHYLKKGEKNSDYQSSENNPKLNKENHVKTRTTWQITNDDKKIKTEMLEYNIDGNVTGWISYNGSEEKTGVTSYEYNSNGLLIRKITKSNNGNPEIISAEIFGYDDKDRLVKYIFNSMNRRDSIIYEYDDNSNSVSKSQFMKDILTYKTLRFYNENDFLVKNIYNDKADTTINEYTYYTGYADEIIYKADKTVSKHRIKFDSNNNETESSTLTSDSSFQVQRTSEFSSLKKLKETTFRNGHVLLQSEFKYDENGNLIEKDYSENGFMQYKTIYKYSASGLVTEEEIDFMAADSKDEKTIYTYEYY